MARSPTAVALKTLNSLLNQGRPGCPGSGCLGECPIIEDGPMPGYFEALVTFWGAPLPVQDIKLAMEGAGLRVLRYSRTVWADSKTDGKPDLYDDSGRKSDGTMDYEVLFTAAEGWH